MYYCDNWYLDGWDYDCEVLCSFVVDCILELYVFDLVVIDVGEVDFNELFFFSYGIFVGMLKVWVMICFFVYVVCWVVDEYWYL